MAKQKEWYKRWWAITLFVVVGLIIIGSLLPDSNNNSQVNCEYKSYDQINSQIRIGMTKSEIVRMLGNADSVYATNLGAGSPCRTIDVLRYSCNGITTAIGFCDGEYIGSIKKE